MKDIAIVGNAHKLKNQYVGSLIDKHELVFRVHPLKLDKDITGLKTDIYCCEPNTYHRFKQSKLDCRLWMITPEEMTDQHKMVFQQKFGFQNEYMDFPFEFERALRVHCNARPTEDMAPTTGGKVIYTVINKYPGSTITLYGFDWYSETPNNYWYVEGGSEKKTARKFRVEEHYVKKVLTKCHDINFCDTVLDKPEEKKPEPEEPKPTKPEPIKDNGTEKVDEKDVSSTKNKRRKRGVQHVNSNEGANSQLFK